MPDLSRATWAAPLFDTWQLPGSDSLLGGALGVPTFLQGTDPVPYARETAQSWLAPGAAVGEPGPHGAAANSPVEPAGFTLFNPFDTSRLKEYGAAALVGVLAVGMVLLGLWYITKG